MDKTLFQSISDGVERQQMLLDNADGVEEISFKRMLTPEQIADLKDELSEQCIQLKDTKADKKAHNAMYNERIKKLETESDRLTDKIREGADSVMEQCYKMIDQEEGMVGYYDKDGILVLQRPLKREERQTTIMQFNRKTGTND